MSTGIAAQSQQTQKCTRVAGRALPEIEVIAGNLVILAVLRSIAFVKDESA